ncbi:spore germination protein [Ornithinibacillus bavariensis]|uniref:spore germination protein n=1 Tax=Ornithinibacillus bavariensis TaxID=545502 RepID=UPI000EB97E5B|nr:spore germination protein [Ornithinibacillus sp.]
MIKLRKSVKKKDKEVSESPKQNKETTNLTIDPSLEQTLKIFREIYTVPTNHDVIIRNLSIPGKDKPAAIIFIKTITNPQIIEQNIIKPLQSSTEPFQSIEDIVSAQSISTENNINQIATKINNGNVALFIEGEDLAFLFDASNFESRTVEKTENENVVKGPKEAFNEKAATNISLIRKRIKSENLVVESAIVSKESKNDLFIIYQKDLVNEKLLQNVKARVKSLDTNAIQNLSLLEQYIEERKYSIFPTTLYTERPDRAASFIEDGYIILIMDNSPDTLIIPATFWSFYHSAEDHYLRLPYANFTRLLRILALFITLFASALYVAVVTFHAEMIPPDLLLAIAATRERVPFPAAIEVFIMEIAFQLIREAGLRVPSPIGPTIGIVGALILGQAAVQANIVSPIVVIIVALGGLSSFAIGDISMNFAIRISRFMMLLSASIFGLYGITSIFVMGLFYMLSIKSFGVPYLAPMTPNYISSEDTIIRRTLQKEIFRPGYVKPKNLKKRQGEN